MSRAVLFLFLVALASMAAPAPAEKAASSDVLELLDGALAAGEGVPAKALLQRYMQDHVRSSRIKELEVLTDFYLGDYESAAAGVEELRQNPRTPIDLGDLADVILATHETTKGYETFRYEGYEVRYSPGDDEILVPYAIDTLKAAAEALEIELGVKMVSPVRLEIYPDAESLSRVSTLSVEAIRNTGTIALCKWGRLMIASPRTHRDGTRSLYCRDPDGNTVQLLHQPGGSTGRPAGPR